MQKIIHKYLVVFLLKVKRPRMSTKEIRVKKSELRVMTPKRANFSYLYMMHIGEIEENDIAAWLFF